MVGVVVVNNAHEQMLIWEPSRRRLTVTEEISHAFTRTCPKSALAALHVRLIRGYSAERKSLGPSLAFPGVGSANKNVTSGASIIRVWAARLEELSAHHAPNLHSVTLARTHQHLKAPQDNPKSIGIG
jgi:hypothetical protein